MRGGWRGPCLGQVPVPIGRRRHMRRMQRHQQKGSQGVADPSTRVHYRRADQLRNYAEAMLHANEAYNARMLFQSEHDASNVRLTGPRVRLHTAALCSTDNTTRARPRSVVRKKTPTTCPSQFLHGLQFANTCKQYHTIISTLK